MNVRANELLHEELYAMWQSGVPISAMLDSIQGLINSVHRDPVVHGDPDAEPLCWMVHNQLGMAKASALKLEAMGEEA